MYICIIKIIYVLHIFSCTKFVNQVNRFFADPPEVWCCYCVYLITVFLYWNKFMSHAWNNFFFVLLIEILQYDKVEVASCLKTIIRNLWEGGKRNAFSVGRGVVGVKKRVKNSCLPLQRCIYFAFQNIRNLFGCNSGSTLKTLMRQCQLFFVHRRNFIM